MIEVTEEMTELFFTVRHERASDSEGGETLPLPCSSAFDEVVAEEKATDAAYAEQLDRHYRKLHSPLRTSEKGNREAQQRLTSKAWQEREMAQLCRGELLHYMRSPHKQQHLAQSVGDLRLSTATSETCSPCFTSSSFSMSSSYPSLRTSRQQYRLSLPALQPSQFPWGQLPPTPPSFPLTMVDPLLLEAHKNNMLTDVAFTHKSRPRMDVLAKLETEGIRSTLTSPGSRSQLLSSKCSTCLHPLITR